MTSDLAAVALTHWLYRRPYQIVRDAGDYGITRDALAQKLYAHRTDGDDPAIRTSDLGD